MYLNAQVLIDAHTQKSGLWEGGGAVSVTITIITKTVKDKVLTNT